MTTEFSYETALAILRSGEEFCIDFDAAWQWLGYSKKSHAKVSLMGFGFTEGVDYVIKTVLRERHNGNLRAPSSEQIHLTYDCFVSFCMLAQTERGKEVRLYFIKAEKELRRLQAERAAEALAQSQSVTKFLGTWREVRKSTKDGQTNFQNACLAKKHPACHVHDYITKAVTGMTAKQARAQGEYVEGDPTVGLNYQPNEQELAIIGRAKQLYCSYRRGTWKEQCQRAIDTALEENM